MLLKLVEFTTSRNADVWMHCHDHLHITAVFLVNVGQLAPLGFLLSLILEQHL